VAQSHAAAGKGTRVREWVCGSGCVRLRSSSSRAVLR
jgi:hypothetical protein